MTADDVIAEFRAAGALREGHFVLSSAVMGRVRFAIGKLRNRGMRVGARLEKAPLRVRRGLRRPRARSPSG